MILNKLLSCGNDGETRIFDGSHNDPALVYQYRTELDKRIWHHLKQTNDSWRVNETYIKVNVLSVSLS
jgi:hypothetical protein